MPLSTIEIGKLRAILALDTAQYEAGARKASQTNETLTRQFSKTRETLQTMQRTLAGLGIGLGVAGVVNFAREIGNFAGRMIDLSAETGIATSRLQALDQIASEAGLTVEDLSGAVTQLQRRLAGGDESAASAVDKLGFAVGEVLAMRPDEAFIRLGESIARIEDPAQRVLKTAELFGARVGPRMLRVMTEDFGKLVDEIEKKGPIISDEVLKAADAFDEFFDRSERRIKAGVVNITAALVAGAVGWRESLRGALSDESVQFEGRAGDIALPKPQDVIFGSGLPERDKAAEAAFARRMKAAEEYRAFINSIGEREIEDEEKRLERQRQGEESLRQFTNEIEEQRIRDHADSVEQREHLDELYREHRNAIGEQEIKDYADQKTREAKIDEQYRALKNQIAEEEIKSIEAQQREQTRMWEFFAQDLTFSISNGFADMLVGLRGFKDGFVGIWQDIRRSVANILSQMLADFIGGYVRRAVAAASAGSLAAGATGGAGGLAGLAGGGAGLAALASNPFTIAAAAGIGLGVAISKGFLRGGEEASQVSPRRDRLIGQFGGWGPMAAQLKSNQLMGALGAADTVGEFELAQGAIVSRFAMMGKTIKSFATGGFIPPGVTQPAILHGGTHGEVVMPLDKAAARGTVVNNYWTISGLDGQDVLRVVKDKIAPALTHMQRFNVDGYTTQQKLALGIR